MTPLRLLSLWRERWGKTNTTQLERPYLNSRLGDWSERFARSPDQLWVGWVWMTLGWFVVLTVLLAGVRFDWQGQWVATTMLLLVSLLVRRYQGHLMTLMLVGFALISSVRYIVWRFNDTLVPAFSLDYLWSIGFWGAELFGIALFAVGLAQAMWPLTQAIDTLPEDVLSWPSVSVLVVGHGHTVQDIDRSVAAARAAQWPHSKLSCHVIDGVDRESVRASLAVTDTGYLLFTDEPQGVVGALNRAIAQSKDDLVVVLMAGQTPSEFFLQSAAGWFASDVDLGLVCTPDHFLVPELPFSLAPLNLMAPEAEFLMVRRQALMLTKGIPTEPLSLRHHVAKVMVEHNFSHSFVLATHEGPVRLLEPFATSALRWKLWLARLRESLGAHKTWAVVLVMVAPLLYLLTDVATWRATPHWWLAYATPHLLQAYLLHHRLKSGRHLPLWRESREALLAAYLMVLTFFTTSWTQLQTVEKATSTSTPATTPPLNFSPAKGLLMVLHGLAIVTGLWNMAHASAALVPTLAFYLVWSTAVLMLLTSEFAVAREVQEVAKLKLTLMTRSGMVRLPNNRTVTCETLNFPQTPLQLLLPTEPRLRVGDDLTLSVFHQSGEFTCKVHVVQMSQTMLTVDVATADLVNYTALGEASFARGADWPGWLPGAHIDRLVPPWLPKALNWALGLIDKTKRPRVRPSNVAAPLTKARILWKKKA